MNLEEYFNKYMIIRTSFAEKAGISYASIYKILRGGKVNHFIAKRIEEMTNGLVTAESIMKEKS
jgi:predicted transcriptional regulator